MDEDRDATMAFFELRPLLFDGTWRTVSLAGWLFDMETIFRICHIEAHLQVLLVTEAMLPYIPQELVDPEWRALHIIRDGLPPEVKYFVPAPEIGVSLEDMIDAIIEAEIIVYMVQVADPEDVYHVDPVDDAGILEPLFEGILAIPEDPIPAIPLQEIPPQEAEAGPDDDDMDPADAPVHPGENPEDPPVILIESDDEEPEEWEEFEDMEEEELEDLEEQEEDREEIPFDDEDWDVFSDVTTE